MRTPIGRFLMFALLISASPVVAEIRNINGLVLNGAFVQGGLVVGQAPPDSKIVFQQRNLRLTKEGRFLLAFSRNAEPEARLLLVLADGERRESTLQIASRTWETQHISGLPERKVSPAKVDLQRIQNDRKLLVDARKRDSAFAGFNAGFASPLQGRVTGRFGTRRVLNGQPRQPHLGLDVAAPLGTPVTAVADGVIVVAHDDMFFTGKTVLIDHGHGLSSVYAHLDSITLKAGQPVSKGQPIGAVGMTGRASGPHLHWGMTLFDIHLDPELLDFSD